MCIYINIEYWPEYSFKVIIFSKGKWFIIARYLLSGPEELYIYI